MKPLLILVALCASMCYAQQPKIDWKNCEAVSRKAQSIVSKFNQENAAYGLQITVTCSYGGPKSYVVKPERHVPLTTKEIKTLHELRSLSNSAFTTLDSYEDSLFIAHHTHKPKLGDACYYFVGIVVGTDYITVDPNPFDPSCRQAASSKSTLEIGTGHPSTPGHIEIPLSSEPQTAQAPKLKEYPTLKACQAAEGLGGASNYGPNPDTTTLYDCQKLKDGNWAWFEDKNKTVVSFSSTDSGVIEYGNSSAPAGDPQMMVPTMHDKVTHTRELGCEKGYELWNLSSDLWTMAWNGTEAVRTEPDTYKVCVKPSFIAQLRRIEK